MSGKRQRDPVLTGLGNRLLGGENPGQRSPRGRTIGGEAQPTRKSPGLAGLTRSNRPVGT